VLASLVAGPLLAAEREVRVGVYDNPPKIAAGADGQPSGILGDLLRAVAAAEGWTIKPVPCGWEACLAAVQAGTIDLMPDVAYSESRARVFDFHRVPALHSWSQLYRRDGVVVQSMLDLEGRRVAVLDGSVQQESLRSLLAGFGLKAELIPVRSFDEGFAAVADARADAVAANHHFGGRAADRYGLLPTGVVFLPSRLFYATADGRNADLLAAVDRHLEPWQADPDSIYYRTLQTWGAAAPKPVIPPAFWWGLVTAVGLLVLALGGMALLRREVARRTGELRASEQKLSTILDSVDMPIYIKDRELRYRYANRKACELLGRPAGHIVGLRDDDFFGAPALEAMRAGDRQVLDTGERVVTEEVSPLRDGSGSRTYLSVKLPLYSPDNEVHALCGIATDITDQHQFLREIHQLAFFDPLTHLANRRQLIERLQQQLTDDAEIHGSHALLLVNLDRFKDINDTQGPGTGDQMLQQAAQRLSVCARHGDLVARLSGDEFAVLLDSPSLQLPLARHQVEQLARRILQSVGEVPYHIAGQDHRISACIGVVLLADGRASVEDVLKRADLALMQAKASGRGMVRFFQPDMEAVVAARAALEADLREGLARHQFLLHYQPQVDDRGRMFGVEALVRWQHPARGMVAPGSFIGLAEVSGLIEPLGQWILRTACRQIAEWGCRPETAALRVAVNISARQLHHPDFVQQVLAVLAEAGADPRRLELELTESHLVEDVDGAVAKMHALKVRGVRLSLDDFGTGYSSLSYLKRLPLDQLKIDQSFVRDLLIDANDLSLVKAIIDMGRSLQLAVIAEGVETQAQRDMLAQAGCNHFQGYLYSRPVPVDELAPWLAGASEPAPQPAEASAPA